MKKKLSQLPKTVARIDEKLTDLERRLNQKFNEQNLELKRLAVFKTLYYFKIALMLIASALNFFVKLLEVYNEIP